jgi:N-acetylmuramoyl-L-alanine amidase
MLIRVFLLFFVLSWFQSAFSMAKITKVRAWKSPEKTRVVLEVTKKSDYSVFQLHKPERVVVDLKNTTINSDALKDFDYSGLIVSSRNSKRDNNSLRLVLQLRKTTHLKDFQLQPSLGYRHRLVLDLFEKPIQHKKTVNQSVKKLKPSSTKAKQLTRPIVKKTNFKAKKSVAGLRHRDIIVAIDAGHGGEDPGAAGKRGTKEKKIVLSIARKLARQVNKQPGMKAVMIRTGDYYVSLRARTNKARRANADVFISIHADAFRNSKARGSSVFILSKRGASSETARWLADKENSADLAGGVSLDDKDDLLAKVLLDLSQTASIEGSNSVAKKVLRGLKKIGKTHKKSVERAGFVVLKSPDIPSILVETGFISNPYEEQQLRKTTYQKKVADAIFAGINDYFKRYPIPGTIYGQHLLVAKTSVKQVAKTKSSAVYQTKRQHKVVRGDNLSLLAKRYRVRIKDIKRLNRMRNNTLILGKKLIIP